MASGDVVTAAVLGVRWARRVLYIGRMQPVNDIPEARRAEYDALVSLLMAGAGTRDAETEALAAWIASSALKDGHLWQGMGLGSRDELRAIMRENFSALYEANTKDMRWKRFFYKRLCGWDGFDA